MSTLFLKTNALNQKFNSLIYKNFPITYNPDKKEWKYEGSIRKIYPYLFVNFFLVPWAGILLIILFPIMILFPEMFTLVQKVGAAFCAGALIPICLLLDFIVFSHGAELAVLTSFGVATKRKYHIPPHFSYPKDDAISIVLSEFHKIARGVKPVDWSGLVGLYTFQFMNFLSVFLPPLFIYKRMDPLSMFLKALFSPGFLPAFLPNFLLSFLLWLFNVDDVPSLGDHWFFRAFVYVVVFTVAISAFITMKTFILLTFAAAQSALEVLHYLLRTPFNYYGQLQLYREGQVAEKLVHSTLKVVIGGYLGMAFYLLLLCMNLTLWGYRRLPWNVYAFMPSFTLIHGLMATYVFVFGCLLHDVSEEVLASWKRQITRVARQREMKRVLGSLMRISVPVGEVGIMDRAIKVNYLDRLLDGLVNSSIVAQDFLG